jgi:hypothetical protein
MTSVALTQGALTPPASIAPVQSTPSYRDQAVQTAQKVAEFAVKTGIQAVKAATTKEALLTMAGAYMVSNIPGAEGGPIMYASCIVALHAALVHPFTCVTAALNYGTSLLVCDALGLLPGP